MNELWKYLPVLMQLFGRFGKYAKYLIYLPALFQLIERAQKEYPKHGAGALKLAWVTKEFTALIDWSEGAGIIPDELAKALRDGTAQIVTAIVEVIKAAGGFDEPDDNTGTPKPSGKYLVIFPSMPDTSNYSSGDEIWKKGDEDKWMATQKGVGIGRPKAPWTVVLTVT